MNNKTMAEINQHVKILGWLYIATSILTILIGVFVLFVISAAGALSGEPEAVAVTSFVAVFVAGLLVVLAAPGLIAGVGLLKRKQWGRLLALVIGILNLVNFPLGTAVGVYAIWLLLPQETTEYFAAPKLA